MRQDDMTHSSNLLTWDGLFRNRGMEASYMQSRCKPMLQRTRVLAILTGIAYLGGSISDFSFAGGGSRQVLLMGILRLITFFLAMVTAAGTYRRKKTVLLPYLTLGYFIGITATECVELWLRPELGGQIIPFLAFVNIVLYLFFPIQLKFQIIGGLIAMIAYMTVFLQISHSFSDFYVVLIVFVLVNLMGTYVSRSMHMSKRTQYHTLQELRETNLRLQKEIENREETNLKLEKMASIDDLTKVYNRRYFIEKVKEQIKVIRDTNRKGSLLFMDLDLFKDVNDTYGHSTGDRVLVTVARIIKNSMAGKELFGRFGGEEFALFMPDSGVGEARERAEHICRLVSGIQVPITGPLNGVGNSVAAGYVISTFPSEHTVHSVSVTISVGVTEFSRDRADTFDSMMRYADQALYMAKQQGRDRVVVKDITALNSP